MSERRDDEPQLEGIPYRLGARIDERLRRYGARPGDYLYHRPGKPLLLVRELPLHQLPVSLDLDLPMPTASPSGAFLPPDAPPPPPAQSPPARPHLRLAR